MSHIEFLERAGCSQYADLFEEYSLTDINDLMHIDRDILLEIGVKKLGDRIRILKESKKLQEPKDNAKHVQQLQELISNISELSTTSTNINEEVITERHCVIFILNDGSAKKVNISGCFNADSIKKRLIKRLPSNLLAVNADGQTTQESSDYDVFIVDYSKNVLRLLYDIELVTICHSNDRVEKNRLIFVSKDQTPTDRAINASKKLYLKTITALNHIESYYDAQSGMPNTPVTQDGTLRIHKEGKDKLRKIFDQRPPSEFISTNIAGYFPHADTKRLEKALRESYRQSARISMKSNNSRHISSESNRVGDILLKHSNAVDMALLQSLDNNNAPSSKPEVIPPSTPQEEDNEGKIKLMEETESIDDYYMNSDEEHGTVSLPTKIVTPKNWLKGARIGSGSFGTVYLGMNAQTGELMAVKQVEIKPAIAATADANVEDKNAEKNVAKAPSTNLHRKMIDALQHEMSLLKELQHENIVTYYGSSQEGGNLNIFLEYVPGGSVSSMLSNYGPFEEPLIVNFTRQILIGVAYLHRKNIIHRDIKGANILIDIKGCVKITDFGISKKLSPLNQENQDKRTSLQGSVYWMSPEVVKQTATTSKADIWSTGCVVIEMFTGKHPYPDFSQMQALFKIGTNVTPEIPSWASPQGRDFIRKTFELDYQRRPTAIELLQESWLESHII
ncbi:Serine/threonine-protein kinase STE11 [Nakaseomyces glabratus]|nr:Serine/threonine-protein kinase STE11 [Nakaseomyces glabratus]KTB26700.1 Serine/threonine-protein kinase STE11 [Nakaseomyces glabratus]